MQTISRARVFINRQDIEWKEGQIITSAEIRLYNRQGEEVNSRLLNMTINNVSIDSVVVEMNILPMMSFETSELVQVNGKARDGYEANIKITPETIWVAARQEVLDQMGELTLERNSINVDNLDETTVVQLKVQKPSEDAILSNDTVTVTIDVNPVEP